MLRSPWNPEWQTAVQKVSRLIESLFHCKVRISTVESFLEHVADATGAYAEQDLAFINSKFFAPPSVIRSNRTGLFAFPLRVRRASTARDPNTFSLVGMTEVFGLAASDDQRLEQIAEFLQLAVEARLDAFERLLEIEQHAEATRLAAAIEETISGSPKIVPLFRLSEKLASLEQQAGDPDTIELTAFSEQMSLDRAVLLIAKSPAPSEPSKACERIALEIFNRTSLWFFVNIADLQAGALDSFESFRDLGRLCLYIPDLAALSTERQLRLAEFLARSANDRDSGMSADYPRVVAAVSEEPARLVGRGVLLPHLPALFDAVAVTSQSTPTAIASELERQTAKAGGLPSHDGQRGTLIPLLQYFRRDDNTPPTIH